MLKDEELEKIILEALKNKPRKSFSILTYIKRNHGKIESIHRIKNTLSTLLNTHVEYNDFSQKYRLLNNQTSQPGKYKKKQVPHKSIRNKFRQANFYFYQSLIGRMLLGAASKDYCNEFGTIRKHNDIEYIVPFGKASNLQQVEKQQIRLERFHQWLSYGNILPELKRLKEYEEIVLILVCAQVYELFQLPEIVLTTLFHQRSSSKNEQFYINLKQILLKELNEFLLQNYYITKPADSIYLLLQSLYKIQKENNVPDGETTIPMEIVEGDMNPADLITEIGVDNLNSIGKNELLIVKAFIKHIKRSEKKATPEAIISTLRDELKLSLNIEALFKIDYEAQELKASCKEYDGLNNTEHNIDINKLDQQANPLSNVDLKTQESRNSEYRIKRSKSVEDSLKERIIKIIQEEKTRLGTIDSQLIAENIILRLDKEIWD